MMEGRKDDQGKARFELIPPELLFAVARVLTFGAEKYSDRNWESGMSWGRVFGATMRHLWAWWGGQGPTTKSFLFGDFDHETGFSHLWHAACCITFLIAYEERDAGRDDRMTAGAGKGGEDNNVQQVVYSQTGCPHIECPTPHLCSVSDCEYYRNRG